MYLPDIEKTSEYKQTDKHRENVQEGPQSEEALAGGAGAGRGSETGSWIMPAALVTGGSRGIGAATARTLAHRGWSVAIVHASDASKAQAKQMQHSHGIVPIQADVSHEEEVQRSFTEAEEKLGAAVTHVVNNAGVFGPGKTIEHSEIGEMQHVLNVNVIAPMLVSRELIRRQSIHKGGSGGAICNVSSGAAYQCSPTTPLYSVSKGAVNSLTNALAAGLNFEEHGIRANAVSPGLTNTDMVANVRNTCSFLFKIHQLVVNTRPSFITGDCIAFVAF